MSDDVDRAQEREEEMRSDAIAEQRRHGHDASRVSAEFCALCEDAIPLARRLTLPGVQTCVFCQEDIEKGLRP